MAFNLLSGIVQLLIIWLNKLINLLKYPIAILLLIGIPFLLLKLFDIIQIMVRHKEHYYPMLMGMGAYIVVLGLMYLSKSQFNVFFLGLLGFSMVYHIHSTYKEIHYKQSDLKEVGFLYAWIFLPSANLLASVMLLSLIPNDRIYLRIVMNKFYDYYLSYVSIIDKFF